MGNLWIDKDLTRKGSTKIESQNARKGQHFC